MNKNNPAIIRIQGLNPVIEKYNELIQTKKVLLILDVDDVTLSSKIGQKFVDGKIKKLVDISFDNGLLFLTHERVASLTARCKSLQRYTRNQLNSAQIIHRGKYIDYKVICSPEDNDGDVTKGSIAIKYLIGTDYEHVIFVDDCLANCQDVGMKLVGDGYENTIYLLKVDGCTNTDDDEKTTTMHD